MRQLQSCEQGCSVCSYAPVELAFEEIISQFKLSSSLKHPLAAEGKSLHRAVTDSRGCCMGTGCSASLCGERGGASAVVRSAVKHDCLQAV